MIPGKHHRMVEAVESGGGWGARGADQFQLQCRERGWSIQPGAQSAQAQTVEYQLLHDPHLSAGLLMRWVLPGEFLKRTASVVLSQSYRV